MLGSPCGRVRGSKPLSTEQSTHTGSYTHRPRLRHVQPYHGQVLSEQTGQQLRQPSRAWAPAESRMIVPGATHTDKSTATTLASQGAVTKASNFLEWWRGQGGQARIDEQPETETTFSSLALPSTRGPFQAREPSWWPHRRAGPQAGTQLCCSIQQPAQPSSYSGQVPQQTRKVTAQGVGR